MARRWLRTPPLMTARTKDDQIRTMASAWMSWCHQLCCGIHGAIVLLVWRLWCGGASVNKCSRLYIASFKKRAAATVTKCQASSLDTRRERSQPVAWQMMMQQE